MAVNTNLYPPIVDTYIPAFIIDSNIEENNVCKIYFSLSQFNSRDEIKNVQVSIRNQYTNLSTLNKNKYPCEVMLTELKIDNTKTSDDKYYIEIRKTDMQDERFEINQYYKIQMRFTGISAASVSLTTPQAIDSWLAANLEHFSEWSTVCLARGISEPIVNVWGYVINESGELEWSNINPIIFGELTFKNSEETEKMKNYQIKLYNQNGDILTDSGLIYPENQNSINYTLKYNFIPGIYSFTIEYTTLNSYKNIFNSGTFKIEISEDTATDLFISAESDMENGRNIITIKKNISEETFTGTITLRRTSSNSNFTIWDELHSYHYTNAAVIKEVFNDLTIENGVIYKYCIQKQAATASKSSIKYLKTPITTFFEHMFLTTKDKQLNIKFNPSLTSFKKIIQETKTETLGSQFPFIRRNGIINYAQFPIGGLISFQIDENDLFTSKKELYGNNLSTYESYNKANRITNDNDVIYEKLFRDKVIEFLYDNQPKLFRSPTEGNFIVKIMDISFSPNTTLGRRIWSFTATANEIAECNIDNFKEYNILEGNDE